MGYDPKVAPPQFILEGKKGEASHKVEEYDSAARRLFDTEITQRTIVFMRRSAAVGKPFYIYAGIIKYTFQPFQVQLSKELVPDAPDAKDAREQMIIWEDKAKR